MNAVAKPRYQQLKEMIIRRISDGELLPLERVPSENELVESMQVSRMTANRALRELTTEGYVERIAGRGTFVADFRARSHLLEVQNIADEITRRGHSHRSEVLRQSQQHARGEIAKALHVEQGSRIFHLLLVHYENGVPVQVEDRHVLADFAPDCLAQDFTQITPSAYLTGIAPLAEAEQVVRAAQPNRAIRKRLQMAAGEPCLVVIRRTWSHGRAVTFARLHHPGSRYELSGHYTPPGTNKSTEELPL
ncbi:MAG: histidine utilization repressor [Proteobacteria bacterium]|nr:histidine utilization repressor [Pseudomonadota bacterium]MDA1062845.1 histidine utilization repressor [Pseudomonadota bacterium]